MTGISPIGTIGATVIAIAMAVGTVRESEDTATGAGREVRGTKMLRGM